MPSKDSRASGDPLWFKDAVIYETHIKAFYDSDGDGVGDFRGLIQKLDYLENLGVTAIWLLPFYPSPGRDDGYDIADYYGVNPAYGTLKDFREFLRAAHARGLRVITELVLNHTSDQNPWFQKSRRAEAGSADRDLYVWSETPDRYREARIIFKDFETSNWTWDPVARAYYWHRFYSHQPDLNFENPRVHTMLFKVIDFWLGLGVDGLRLDAVPYLYEAEGTNCENLPATHEFLRRLRAHIDEKFSDRMLLAEANQWPEDAAAYFGAGDKCQMCFHFPVMPRMFMALQMEDRFPIIDILDQTPAIPDNCQWALFLRNHDELTLEMVTDEERDYMYRVYASDPRARINLGIRRRLAPLLLNNRRKIELINILLFSLPGTPILYYGDEIGMGDNIFLGDRNGVRTPMQWSPDRNAGFSNTNPQQLFLPITIDPEYHYEAVNVDNQERNLSSLLWWMRRVIAMRRKYRAFGHGSLEFLYPDNGKVLAFLRKHEEETILVVVNLSRFSQVVELNLAEQSGQTPVEVFSQNRFPLIKDTPYTLTLGPHDHHWLLLEEARPLVGGSEGRLADAFAGVTDLTQALTGDRRKLLEKELLPAYLLACRWFGGKGRPIRTLKIVEDLTVGDGRKAGHLVSVEVAYVDGYAETYLLPVAMAEGDVAHSIAQEHPNAVIGAFDDGAVILYDAIYDQDFRAILLQTVGGRKGSPGRLAGPGGHSTRSLRQSLSEGVAATSTVLRADQSNTSVIYGGKYFFKLYRRSEEGLNPDVELSRHLGERIKLPNAPVYAGSLELPSRSRRGAHPRTIGLVQELVQNQGDAWTFTLDAVGRFLERILSRRPEVSDVPSIAATDLDLPSGFPPEVIHLIGGVYAENARLIGQRTAEMHRGLFDACGDPEFEPEEFGALYQRSLYQSMRNSLRRTFQLVNRAAKNLPGDMAELARSVAGREKEILERVARVMGRKIASARIRVHGDYHLGQLLHTGRDFVIIDFEGEPARTVGERRLKRSALTDVAGMMRSFHYAAHSAPSQILALRPEDIAATAPWVELWYDYVSRVFLQSYLAASGEKPFIPASMEDFKILLEAFLLEKAVYEVGYEINNRPDWLAVPLRGILKILDGA